MLNYPALDPVALSLGPFEVLGMQLGPLNVHWYGLMYLLAFASAWGVAMYRAKQRWSPVTPADVEDMIVYGALGVVLGGRCGYVLFYNLDHFLADPLWLLRVWEGGMSFHGGLLGVLVAMWIFSLRVRRPLLEIMDFVAPLVPLGLAFGRLGNFIGQELWGRPTEAAIGMIFPRDPEGLVRHPSQLYEMFLEGVVLFAIIFWFSRLPRPRASVGSLFLMGYGLFRFIVEFFRQPDAHIGFDLFGWLSRGQLLCIPMILIGLGFFIWSYRTQPMPRYRKS